MLKRLSLALAVGFALAGAAFAQGAPPPAQSGTYKLDPSHAMILFGVSHFNFPDFDFSDTAFGFALGAGADWKLTHHIALRVGEIDFEQFRNFGGGSTGNPLQNGFKAKVGVIFSF